MPIYKRIIDFIEDINLEREPWNTLQCCKINDSGWMMSGTLRWMNGMNQRKKQIR